MIKLSVTPGAINRPPPRLGEHTAEILSGLGYEDEDIARLIDGGVARRPADTGVWGE